VYNTYFFRAVSFADIPESEPNYPKFCNSIFYIFNPATAARLVQIAKVGQRLDYHILIKIPNWDKWDERESITVKKSIFKVKKLFFGKLSCLGHNYQTKKSQRLLTRVFKQNYHYSLSLKGKKFTTLNFENGKRMK
jgi:hypothetical protein